MCLVLLESFSHPDVVVVHTDRSACGDVEKQSFRRCSYRQSGSAIHRALICKRLSSSAGEVQISPSGSRDNDEKYSLTVFRSGESLESSHSLTYLEWVHERQTRRMRTRSEWFLLPAPPTADSEISGLSSTNMLRPHSQYIGSAMNASEGHPSDLESTDEYIVNITRKLPLLKSCEPDISVSSACTSRQFASLSQPVKPLASSMAGGVVRRRSLRTHYVRPSRPTQARDKEQVRNYERFSCISILVHERPVIIFLIKSGIHVDSSSRSVSLYRINMPHACSRSLPTSRQLEMLPSSSMKLLQQHPQRSVTLSLEHQKQYHSSVASGNSSSIAFHGDLSKVASHPKNVHF
ncbi:unnamed protein product [Thelazia callipaeda]|uniref:Ras-associating domain-containing protein n=1 Tax=Thelazia callipaeda TaxID=103827 RepID=A0A0N5D0U6_THECL|nr:unnamed protein product [Thelazia callipaeda]